MKTTIEILKNAKSASTELALLSTKNKNQALLCMATAIEGATSEILSANALDVESSGEALSEVMIDRLILTEARIKAMADGIRNVAKLPDPIGEQISQKTLENGLTIEKVRVPLGVIGIIYESRPNVTSDAAALCFKSGNACVLKCGKEAHRTSTAIIKAIKTAIKPFCSEDAVNILEDNSRTAANELMNAVDYIDVLIPRGGAGLIRSCVENAKVPCIKTGTGICHIYVDKNADFDKALNIIENAKMQRPSVCNAAEVCLVHKDTANDFLPLLAKRLTSNSVHPAELRLDAIAATVIDGTPAGENDFDTEFLDYILAVKVVDSLDDAISHISKHSTQHSEAIITESIDAAERFLNEIDSTSVYWNASTRFTDGGEFGLGCEIGISTQKLHARGPMGLEELTSYKYKIRGNGQIR
ncbi:MAG: glutamate-5-semialdehyde dehydrogenase [Eubacteriales bacterium]